MKNHVPKVDSYSESKGRKPKIKRSEDLDGLPQKRRMDTHISYHDFCEQYDWKPGNEPIVYETFNRYVEKHGLQKNNWATMCQPFDVLLDYLGRDNSILKRLIYSICDKSLKEESYKIRVAGGGQKVIKGAALKRKAGREENRKREKYLDALDVMCDYIGEFASYLMPDEGDSKNPLSGYRMREILWQLKALRRAEIEIEALKKEDKGRQVRYVHDPETNKFVREGIMISDPSTVMLIYVWKAKEEKVGLPLSKEDYAAMASLMEFMKLFPAEIEDNTFQQITLLKDRIKYYKKMNIEFVKPHRSFDYHPTVLAY